MTEIIVTSDDILSDPNARNFINFLKEKEEKFGIGESVLYYKFPTYSDYDSITHSPDFLLLTIDKGIFAIKFANNGEIFDKKNDNIINAEETIEEFSSNLLGRLLKSRNLRKSRSALKLEIISIIFDPGFTGTVGDAVQSVVITSFDALASFISEAHTSHLSHEEYSEARSIVEGAKAIARPERRVISDPERQIKAAALATLENEIANFDQRQRQVALSTVQGPQRIRGLAGSGKTVILAMKAAHLHLTHPDAKILITFYTRSLQSTLETLITRFYRHYKDEDPNWANVHVRHGWGGARRRGAYSDVCKRYNIQPMALTEARRKSGHPFDYICRDLLGRVNVGPYYDYILIDEGQDFPGGFYELCFFLAKNNRDRKNIIWAYDELQNILNVKMKTPQELFGNDADGQPRIKGMRPPQFLQSGLTASTVG